MVRLKSILIFSIEFLLIFCYITDTAFGTNSSNNMSSVQSGDYLSSEVSNVDYDYYDYFFGLESYGNTVITRYGKLPALETEEQKVSWNSTLKELGDKIKDNVASEYIYPYGEIVTCGTNSQGYFVILFRYGNVDESLLDEIYALIDNAAKEMDIQDVPVEFGYGTYWGEIPLDQEGKYHVFGENIESLSASEVKAIEENMKEKPAKTESKTIAAYGKIPLLKDKKEISAWGDKLFSVKNGAEGKILPYMEKGQVITFGSELTRLEVGINESLSSEKKTAVVEEIYQIIDKEARKRNITYIPVVFGEGVFINDIAIGNGGALEETENLSAAGEKNTGELKSSSNNDSESNNGSNPDADKSGENNSVPGFGLLGSLTCLYGEWKLRKK
ncbi:hypothetical protein SDC9_113825 [bioreactor metagenome]|uniref:Uncharacterized protein n=1 Tax=bioreactor metagenome TaxID=1076179 RepID=A0A645BP07_9ZZZZ